MAIQNRRGAYTDFDSSKAVAGELLVVLSGDENTTDGKAVYIAFASGDVKRLVGSEELENFDTGTAVKYGTTTTNKATSEKVVSCDDFEGNDGELIAVSFAQGNSVNNATLNVNSKGAKPIFVGSSSNTAWMSGSASNYLFRYSIASGGRFVLIGSTERLPSDSAPKMDGTASAGSSIFYSRSDHIHPTDSKIGTLSNLETTEKSSLVGAVNELKGDVNSFEGISDEVKVALLDCFEHVAWTDEHGQEYIDALEAALYPPADLVSISAVYTQGGTVYDNATLDSLKTDLVVTAHYDDSTSETVTAYTLSGTLETGTSTITVSYGGKTDTFDVTVTHAVTQYTITNTLTNCTNSNAATVINEETAYSGALTADSGYIISTVSITMGNTDVTSTAYDSSDGSISIASVTGNVVITAEAVEDVGWISGVPYDIDWSEGYYSINGTTGEVVASTNPYDHVSNLLPCHGVSAVILTNEYSPLFYYDENETYLGKIVYTASSLETPYHIPIPRNAYYVRYSCRQQTPTNSTATPYLFPKLTESTVWQLDTYYVMDFETDSDSGVYSGYGLCYGATKLQSSMYGRSWFYFHTSEKGNISNVLRQNNYDVVDIPANAYYLRLYPNGNVNPWVKFTA